MLKKRLKQIGAWILTASLVLGSAQLPAKAAEGTRTNMSLIATATASGSETASFGPEKAIDGIIDRTALSTRWSSPVSNGPAWLQLSWAQPKNLEAFTIEWEMRKAENYRLEISDTGEEGSWTTIFENDIPPKLTEEIELDKAVTTKNVRLYIEKINNADPDGGVAWSTVSVYEFEAWSQDELPDDRTQAQKIADDIAAPVVAAGASSIPMPEMPQGGTVKFYADYEQIITVDGKIYQPLETRTVKGYYEVTLGDDVAKTQEFSVSVPGRYTDDGAANAKPAVIPELQEWHGTTGSFQASAESRIVVGSRELATVAEEFAKDYQDITKSAIEVVNGAKADVKRGDFYLALTSEDKGLDKEGYAMEIAGAVFVEAEQSVGAYYATRSILQILKQTNGTIPNGLVRDYPKYEVRGLSLDVGRKPFSLDTLYQFAKNLSWYKMNNFQVHLSDNLIFMEDYSSLEEAKEQTYAGFRLESGVLNSEGKSATSEDMYYTKDEFRNFVQDSRAIGVGIVPELDMPAHALPFTRAFPEYRTKKETGGSHAYLIDELDLSNPETTKFAQNIWNDLIGGSNPVFDEDIVLHIGTDEYHGTDGQEGREQFRKFSADMINFVQESGRKVRMWGSLSNKTGTTPVPAEDVQLNVWNTGYSVPADMYKLGYDMINTLDGTLYMVPSGSGSRGGYGDYLNIQNLYNSWQPNNFGGYTIPAGSEQVLGACFAIWHDNIDTRANGISQYDSFARFFDALPIMSAKTWGEAEDQNYTGITALIEKTGTAPNTNMFADVDYTSGTIAEWDFEETLKKDSSVNGNDLTGSENIRLVNSDDGIALRLMGGKSYVTTPLDLVGEDALLTMKVKKDVGADGEQILCESKDAFGSYGTFAFKAVQKNTGKVGFSREGYDFSFDYTLPENEWVTLTFQSGQNEVALYVDGVLVDKNPDMYYANHPEKKLTPSNKVATMMVPIGRIGSETNSFKGQIEYVSVATEITVEGEKVPQSEMTATACSDHSEGRAPAAIDGDNNTYWHSNWASDLAITDEHHWFKVTLANPTVIDTLTYLPRQSSRNGRIFEYSIEVEKADGTKVTVADHETWPDNANWKTATFEPIEAKSVKIQIHDAAGDNNGTHATIGELNLYKPVSFDSSELEGKLAEAAELKESEYTDMSWGVFAKAYSKAQQIAAAEGSTAEEYITAYGQLDAAINGLVAKSVDNRLSDAVKEAEQAKAADYAADSFAVYQQAAAAAANLPESATEAQKKAAAEAVEAAKAALANIGELRSAAQAVSETVLNGCTADSQAAYRSAVQKANAVIADKAATKAQTEAALTELKAAADALVDLSALRAAIAEVKGRHKEDYTSKSWNAFEDALARAEAVLDAEAPDQAEVTKALANLYSADEALVKSEPITSAGMLIIVIDAYAQIDLKGYTEDSAKALENALKNARNVRDKQGAEAEEFEQAIADVLTAAAGLKVDTSNLDTALAAAEQKILALEKLAQDAEKDFSDELTKVRQELEAAKTEAKTELNAVKTELEKAAADAQKKAEEAEAAAKKAQEELEAAQKLAAAQKAELDRLAAQAEDMRKAAEEARQFAQAAQMRADEAVAQTKFAATSANIKAVKSTKKGKVKVTWKKVSGADGYKIMYSQTKDFRKSKSVKASAKSTSKTISKLKSKKTYYFRIRAYKNVDGKAIYSRLSTKLNVKVK